MIEIAGALTGAKTLLDMAKAALDARDDAKVRQALIDAQGQLLEAMSAALDIKTRASALFEQLEAAKGEVRELKAQIEDRARYALTEIRPGAHAYASKPAQEGQGEPAHYLCQPCYDKGVKSVLRSEPPREGRNGSYTCPAAQQHTITLSNALPFKPLPIVRR